MNTQLDPEILEALTDEQRDKLEIIEGLDLSSPRDRMLVDFPDQAPKAEGMAREVKRFLTLAALNPKPSHRIVVSEKVDTLWHYFILHTQEYRRFSQRVFGAYLNHFPILPERKSELASDYLKTRELYRKHFGQPPAEFWGDDQQICWGGCDEAIPTEEDPLRN